MKSFESQVADWARTKPADEVYNYASNSDCALCQFLRETGFSDQPHAGGSWWSDGVLGSLNMFDQRLATALIRSPRTFGALADRLSS